MRKELIMKETILNQTQEKLTEVVDNVAALIDNNISLADENAKLCRILNKIVKIINHDDDNVVYNKFYLLNSQEEILDDLRNAIDGTEKRNSEATNTQQENTFAPMKVSVAVPTADGDVALVEVNNFDELKNLKKNGVTKEMIENAEKLKHNDKPMFVGNMLHQIEVGRVYRHFKGKLYLVLDLAHHSETGEQYVVYKALYGDCKTYVRPYLMFASGVDREKYPDVKQTYRFELVED